MICLVIGCGYLGRRVADLWREGGDTVYALTRNRADELRAAGLVPVTGDVTDAASLGSLPRADMVLYAVGLDRAAGRPMREVYVRGLENVLARLPPPGQFLYVSSTGVYGQTGGEEVDEESPAEPIDESGRIVREAELTLLRHRPDAALLRFAGIYGPGRLIRSQALLAGEPLTGDPEKWLNLIHVADGVRAVDHARRSRWAGVVNVCDGVPVTRRAFFTELAAMIGAAPPRFAPGPGDGREANRRVVRKRLVELLLTYPSYREGLAAAGADKQGAED